MKYVREGEFVDEEVSTKLPGTVSVSSQQPTANIFFMFGDANICFHNFLLTTCLDAH